jgi:4-hydroxybenzoate polyprenyltransferase
VRSTAILFGDYTRPLLTAFGITFFTALAYAGYLNKQGPAFYLIAVGGTAAHLVWQHQTVDLENPASCKRQWPSHISCLFAHSTPAVNFIRNGQLGWVVFVGCAVDYLISATA